jgi:hypothetical protein
MAILLNIGPVSDATTGAIVHPHATHQAAVSCWIHAIEELEETTKLFLLLARDAVRALTSRRSSKSSVLSACKAARSRRGPWAKRSRLSGSGARRKIAWQESL